MVEHELSGCGNWFLNIKRWEDQGWKTDREGQGGGKKECHQPSWIFDVVAVETAAVENIFDPG